MTHNDLVSKIAERARQLADMPMRGLRLSHPEAIADYESANLRYLRNETRGSCIEAILMNEFDAEFDFELEDES